MSFFLPTTLRLSLGLFHDDFEKSRNPILTENEYVIILKQIPRDMRQMALDILFQSNLDLKLLDFPALP